MLPVAALCSFESKQTQVVKLRHPERTFQEVAQQQYGGGDYTTTEGAGAGTRGGAGPRSGAGAGAGRKDQLDDGLI